MLKLVLPPDTNELAGLRVAIRQWAGEHDVPEWPLTLIATELVANAMAVTPPTGSIEIDLRDGARGIEITVIDPGPGFEEPLALGALSQPPPASPRGRGLFLVQQLASELRVERHGGRTVVSACRPQALRPDGST